MARKTVGKKSKGALDELFEQKQSLEAQLQQLTRQTEAIESERRQMDTIESLQKDLKELIAEAASAGDDLDSYKKTVRQCVRRVNKAAEELGGGSGKSAPRKRMTKAEKANALNTIVETLKAAKAKGLPKMELKANVDSALGEELKDQTFNAMLVELRKANKIDTISRGVYVAK